jgi:hypothetical protein
MKQLLLCLVILPALLFATCGRKEPMQPRVDRASLQGALAVEDTAIVLHPQNGQDSSGTGTFGDLDDMDGIPCVLPPWPDTVLGVLERAYAERNPELIQALLADDFEFNREDGASWNKDTEITIHSRMFDAQYPRYGAQRLWLDLTNSEWHLLDSSVATGNHLYVVTCDIELWVDCATADASFSATGKTKLIVRRVESAPAKWQIVHWYDYP